MVRATLLLIVALGIVASAEQQPPPRRTLMTFQADAKGLGIRWARIPAGTFQMGCVPGDIECFENEKPRHAVTLTSDYWLMTTEVTLEMFRAFSSDGHPMPLQPVWNSSGRQPTVNVGRAIATEVCAWVGGRLPTEAEWERAARGGVEGEKYSWGNDLLARTAGRAPANIGDASQTRKGGRLSTTDDGGYDDGFAQTAPVGSFPPNRFGLYDMVGNAAEWVSDPYPSPYGEGPVVDPRSAWGYGGVLRGASWNQHRRWARLSIRNGSRQGADDARLWTSGVRCARDVTSARGSIK